MIRLIFLLIVVYLGYRLLKEFIQSRGPAGQHPGDVSGNRVDTGDQGKEEEMALDPVCKSYIPVASSLRVRKGAEVIHFCGDECRQKFISSLKE
jgi:YHS domain-containing protein